MAGERIVMQTLGDIGHLVLCAPPANPTDSLFFDELAGILAEIDSLAGVKGLVVSGQGRHFSSGADIGELTRRLGQRDAATIREGSRRSLGSVQRLAEMPFPVVAAVQGCCLGSGMELALACRYRICTKSALFSLPETRFGLMPGCGGTIRLPRLVGTGKAVDLILSGRNLLAEDALALGIVDLIVDRKDLLAEACRLIGKIGGRTSLFHEHCPS